MKIRLALVLAVCGAGALAQPPAQDDLQDRQRNAVEGLKRMRLLDKPLPSPLRFKITVTPDKPGQRPPVCSIPLITVLPPTKTAPMPRLKPGDGFHMRLAPLPAPPCDEPAKQAK